MTLTEIDWKADAVAHDLNDAGMALDSAQRFLAQALGRMVVSDLEGQKDVIEHINTIDKITTFLTDWTLGEETA